MRRARIRGTLADDGVIELHRVALSETQLVYVAVANRSRSYERGRSKTLYIGVTKRGIRRIASSAAARAPQMFAEHGVRTVRLFVYAVPGRQRVNMARKLERALLLTFKGVHGEIPVCNTQGKNMRWQDEDRYFRRKALKQHHPTTRITTTLPRGGNRRRPRASPNSAKNARIRL